MERQAETKEIEALKNAKLRSYTVNTFKQYWTSPDDYDNKKARVVNELFIVVYSVWHKRLLARVFYLEEYMRYKRIDRKLFEVQRQVAGMSEKISQRLKTGMFGRRVYTGACWYYASGWTTSDANTNQLFPVIDNWSGRVVIGFEQYNDPIKYLKQSCQKYSAYDYLIPSEQEHNHMFEYLLKYEKHPQLEMVMKMGLYHLTKNLTGFRWRKKGYDMLGITKQELPYLKAGMNLKEYKGIREWCLKYKLTTSEAKFALKFIYNKELFSYRLLKYLMNKEISIHDYLDLMKMKEELGLPDENKYLYPVDFHELHDTLHTKIKLKHSEEINKRIKKREKELKKYALEKNGLVIMPILNQEDLIYEGKELHHCVGGYASSVAHGETAIFAIRKAEEKDIPYVTLELRDKNVIQVRGYRNNVSEPLDESVVKFVKQWEKQFRLQGY